MRLTHPLQKRQHPTGSAFASSYLMLGLMVNGQDNPESPHYFIIRDEFDFAHLCIILTGLAFFICLIASFLPKQLREELGDRLAAWLITGRKTDDTSLVQYTLSCQGSQLLYLL